MIYLVGTLSATNATGESTKAFRYDDYAVVLKTHVNDRGMVNYQGLQAQLEDQSRRFLSNPQNLRIDLAQRRVYISSIFKWFGEDFVETYGTEEKFDGHAGTVRAVLNFVGSYLGPEEQKFLATQIYSIHYTDYDRSLNEQKEG